MVIASTATAAPVFTACLKGRKGTGYQISSSRSLEPAVCHLDSSCWHLQDSVQLGSLQPLCFQSRTPQNALVSYRMALTASNFVDLQSLGGAWGQWKGVPQTSRSWQQKTLRRGVQRCLAAIERNELNGRLVDGSSRSFASWLNSATTSRHSGIRKRVLRCQSGDGEGEKGKGSSGNSSSTATEEPDSEASSSTTPSAPPSPSNQPENQSVPHAFQLVDLIGPEKVDPDDVKILKEKAFGYTTFWVTGQEPFGDSGEGVLLLGNLRGKREEVFSKLQQNLTETMGTKYDLFMVEEPNAEDEDPRGGPRISFVLLRKEVSDPGPTALWQYVIAALLFVLTGLSCLELGIASQLSRLPPELVRYFTNPEAVEPPDVSLLVPFIDAALPLAYGVFGIQLFHELGHSVAAYSKKVKMGIPYLIPNITLGSFGAVTQFKSICPDRTAKFDISAAGPLAGGALSAAMLLAGLALSRDPESAPLLVQVPSQLFQGSLLLGGVSRVILGYNYVHAATVGIHPLVIAGWCGLTTTAFNFLPVGCLDGGRAIQAAFGRVALNISGLLTYLFLGLGVLGGPLSLPWGLYILIVQRSPERPALNDVTGVGTWRQGALIVALLLVISTLLPLWDGLADEWGIGLGTPLL